SLFLQYVTKTVEVESAQCKQALMEAQACNQALQEQLSVQRQLLRELEQQLHESQRSSSQLRQQVPHSLPVCAVSSVLNYHVAKSTGVRMNLLTLQPALRTLTCDYNCLKRQVQDFPYMLEKAITEAKQEICQVIGEVSSANQELLRKYKREMNLRKKCHNELVRLKGNIRVLCRVRPICAGDTDAADTKNIVTFDPDDDAVLYLSNKGKLMTFELDKVFPTQATQEEVFQEVQSLVTSCIDGFNVCIFAYGQTGSGKTYTMENSRLTYLLQDSLSGDSKTLMMVQVSPLESNASESVCSLKFAQRVRTVEIGPSSSSRRQAENSSTSSSPTHDSVEVQRHR
ncbi:kinesin-like protein KIFC3, partial [Sinocyclocheilus grahami]|uniref:kinesin-like protein KIFC3 n=1 Tax=Sinocyclocheilus grahami TaxID=75366 RepID=UPI0007ACFAD6